MEVEENIIEKSRRFTIKKIKELEEELSSSDIPNCSIVVNGSYARKEASLQSDFDYFILHPPNTAPTDLARAEAGVQKAVQKQIGKLPASDGAFGATLECGLLSKNIGGMLDDNASITRRILFLIEGVPINNKDLFAQQRDDLIDRYISDEITDHQIGMFFLNDLIRYYRTICVDFEYKTFENNKPWGIRNIKLIFSRKLIYFSGVLIAAEMYQRSAKQKKEIARELISLSPIERVVKACRSSADRAIESYSGFLTAMEDATTRQMLEKVTVERASHNERFKELKNEGHHFSFYLMSALKNTYTDSHPIHRALIM